ncbi:MAG: hypothetical protein L3J52_00150 [Proteobacteria bacterium]|nr:hypothetical protein [Pseudomonadota bacterium]
MIKIAEGGYDTLGSQFSYNESGTNAGWDLEISGGWTTFFANPCGQQLTGDPFLTALDGMNNNRILWIHANGTANITISNLMFLNGSITIDPKLGGLNHRAAGLMVVSTNNTGVFRLQRNAFINNIANFSSAMDVFGFTTMRINNNLFFANNALTESTVELSQSNSNGIYFINNTVFANSQDEIDNLVAGVKISVSGTSSSAIYNNLFWDNDSFDLELSGNGKHYLSHNNIGIAGGVAPFVDSANISLPPQFHPDTFNFTPYFGSPLIDTGMSPPIFTPIPTPFEQNWSHGSVDLPGNLRKQGSRVDIGAYESSDIVFINGFE